MTVPPFVPPSTPLTIYVVVVVLAVPIWVYAPMDRFEPHPVSVYPHGTPSEPVVPIAA